MISNRFLSQPTMEHVEGVTTITFSAGKSAGEENFVARELLHLTEGLGQRHLSLNLANVNSINSAEIGTIVLLCKRRNAAGGRLTLTNVNAHLGEVFKRTHLHEFLDIRSDVPAAALITQ